MKCKKHPRYKVKRKPRTLCESCWEQWISGKPYRYNVSAANALSSDVQVTQEKGFTVYRTVSGEAVTDPGIADPTAYFDGRCGDVPRCNRSPYDDGRG